MVFPVLAAMLALTVAGGVSAQGVHDPAKVMAGTYAVDPYHTQIVWGVSHLGITDFYGQFKDVSGTLVLDPASPAQSRLDISLPVASLFSSSGKLDEELRGADWFDAARFPDVRFESTSVTPTGPDTAEIAGNLTLHGVTRPIVLTARFVGAGRNPVDDSYDAGFSGTATIKRSEFGVTKYIPLVGDEIALTISGAFARKS
ncbi:MAG: YceI family protein [Acetobacteraceae bacterium]|nr:YceI family protein [Acetobacteraceae bacterium]